MPSVSIVRFEGDDLTGVLPALKELLISNSSPQDDLRKQLTQLEAKLMATFAEFTAQLEKNGLAIADVLNAVATEKTDFIALLERVQAGQSPSSEELAAAMATLQSQEASLLGAKDAILQLIPTVESPEISTAPGEPLPDPIVVPPDVTLDDVVITPNDGVGLDGTGGIDLPPTVAPTI
jgi:hypothetical protein